MFPASDAALLEIVDRAQSHAYPDVVSRLQALRDAMSELDGLRWFTQLYLDMTEAVASAAATGAFHEPKFLEALDCRFADLYFAAVASLLRDPAGQPKAWSPLLQARANRAILPLQFALAGVNAHINRDLPVALVATYEALGGELLRSGPRYADYLRINEVLGEVQETAKDVLLSDALSAAEVALGRVDDVLALWSLERARESAFVAAELRFALRHSEFFTSQHLASLDKLVGFAGRGILRPLVLL